MTLFERVQFILMLVIQAVFFGAMALALYEGSILTLSLSVLATMVIWMPSLLAKNYRAHFPLEFQFLLALFVYASFFMGIIHGYYTRFWWWDLALHGASGVALGFIGFLILYSLRENGLLTMSPSLLALFSFAFGLALGALWEIYEFSVDSTFGFAMQKGLSDTMGDLIVDAGGALLMALSGYFYLRFRRRGMGILQYYLTAYLKRNKS